MGTIRINLNEVPNNGCKTGCSGSERKEITENSLCKKAISVIDELKVRCVGEWAYEKIYYLFQYYGIFSQAMYRKWKINYIEIASGPGRCINRDNGIEFDGSAYAILKHEKFTLLNKAIFIDYEPEVVDILSKRINLINADKKAFAVKGDYTNGDEILEIINSYIGKNNRDNLNLIFIDPTDCSVPFATIKKMASSLPRTDFIINIASGTDFNRNIVRAITNEDYNVRDKYITFLGDDNFFKDQEIISLAKQNKVPALRERFRKKYKLKMEMLGFKYNNFANINKFYDLFFASKEAIALELWQKAAINIDYLGQYKMF